MTLTHLQPSRRQLLGMAAGRAGATAGGGTVRARQPELKIGQQYGIGYLPFHVLKNRGLLEAHARKAGIPDLKVTWASLGGGANVNDALLSGAVDIGSGGVGAFLTLWDKSRASVDVRGIAALNALPMHLVSNNPDVQTIRDLTDKDRIALPSVKISIQAVTLQMAAEQAFGPGKHDVLDKLTVSMRHPDALAALISRKTEITGHFGAPPFQNQALETPGVRSVLNSFDVLGGPTSFNVAWTTAAFRARNPELYGVFLSALREAQDLITNDAKEAARIYVAEDQGKLEPAFIEKIVNGPGAQFSVVPLNITRYSDFLARIGGIKTKPDNWRDLFFPELHGEAGS
jgi:NitT/TauT family transport system substrate-binding protein